MSKTAAGGADTPVSRIEHGDEQKAKRIAAWVSNVAQVQVRHCTSIVAYGTVQHSSMVHRSPEPANQSATPSISPMS